MFDDMHYSNHVFDLAYATLEITAVCCLCALFRSVNTFWMR